MELRSCSNLHFIQAVNGGLVIKTLNVYRGRPVLKFKNVKAIYETEDSKNQSSFLEPKDEFGEIFFDSNRVKVERPSSIDNGESDSDLDDPGSGKMTLKQFKDKCKAKKRKLSKFIDSRNEELYKHVKQEIVEDECDLMVPLITWKSKLSKKLKNMGRSLSLIKDEQESFSTPMKIKVEPDCLETANAISFNCDSSLIYDTQVDSCGDSQNSKEVMETVIDCDQGNLSLCSDSQNPRGEPGMVAECDQGHQAVCSDSQNPRESSEIDAECERGIQELCSESQTAICFSGSSSLIYSNEADSYGIVPREITETVTKCDRGTEALISLAKGPQHVRVAYPMSMEHANSEPVEIVDGQVDYCGTVQREEIEIATEAVLETDKPISLVEDTQCCVMNEICYEYVDHAYSEPLQIVSNSCDYIKEVDIPQINNSQCLDLSVLESKGEGYVHQPLCADTSREPIFPISNRSAEILNDFPSPTNEEIYCNIGSTVVQISDVATHGCLQYTKSSHGSDACAPDGNAQDDLLSNLETSTIHSSDGAYSLDPESWFSPCADGSPTTEENQSQSSTPADTERHCFPEMLHQDACEELTTSDDGDYYSKLNCPPQRLLSTRKAISPDSQEKLCKAMESIELKEGEHYKPWKGLSFAQQTGKETKKINEAEGSSKISRIRFTANQKQNTEKSKNDKRHDPTEGVSKGTNLSHAAPRFSTGCNSIEICSQSTIAFSQRQMQDIECLATKLTNELKTMKEIAADRLYSEASVATFLRYKANEVRLAVKNATKVEQLANRWLSMMARDCNRFCKIMRLAEKDSDAPESDSVVNKERKKITFADEAGEQLCHVRLIENKLSPSLEPDTEKPQV